MKIFYYCLARAHSSVIAGYLHLNRLPSDRVPSVGEILAVAEFDKSEPKDRGVPYYLGLDEYENEVYIIGLGKDRGLALQTILNVLKERANLLEWRFFNTLSEIDWVTRIGGFLSRSLHIPVGRIISAWGIQRSYAGLTALVKRTKELCKN